jgi:hypothetical protein
MDEEQWLWMMNYCLEKSLPPAQAWAWARSEIAYNERKNHEEDKSFRQRLQNTDGPFKGV